MKSLHIKVTEQHISEGRAGDSALCPVALAIYDVVPESTSVIVHDSGLTTIDHDGYLDNIYHYWVTPGSAIQFIHDFDAGQAVKPFDFVADEEG